jgi:hypothetical protein
VENVAQAEVIAMVRFASLLDKSVNGLFASVNCDLVW